MKFFAPFIIGFVFGIIFSPNFLLATVATLAVWWSICYLSSFVKEDA